MITIDKKLIAKRLITLRGERSRKEVADAIETSVSALQMYENGKRIPLDEVKVRIASYYGVSVQELFYDFKSHNSCFDSKTETA